MNRPAHRWTPTRVVLLLALIAISGFVLFADRSGTNDQVSPTVVQHDDITNPPLDPTTYRHQMDPSQSLDLTDAERSAMAVDAVAAVAPAVVVVHRAADEGQFGDQTITTGERIGSGVVIDERGYIVASLRTTGSDGAIRVSYANGETVTARIARIDEALQLVLLKVDSEPPAVAPLATAIPLPGEPVLAIGTPLEDFSSTVTGGVIGAVGVTMPGAAGSRPIAAVMQHDAATNRGNEGGPLIDLHGQVVGINVGVVFEADDEVVQGWSFAIPVISLGPLLADLG